MEKLLLLISILFPFGSLLAAENTNPSKALHLIKINEEINVDGKIDAVWNFADSTVSFFQLEPYFNQPTSVNTVAKVLTTEDALYCLMICYDDKKYIQANAGMQDGYTGDICINYVRYI